MQILSCIQINLTCHMIELINIHSLRLMTLRHKRMALLKMLMQTMLVLLPLLVERQRIILEMHLYLTMTCIPTWDPTSLLTIMSSRMRKYTPAIDIWSIGCIFAEVLTGKPLFPGKSIVHQLDLMTDFLGSPSADTIYRIRNKSARKYLADMCKKRPMPFPEKFPNLDPLAICLLQRLLAFDPIDRPTAEVEHSYCDPQ